jgi:hypothetical protein
VNNQQIFFGVLGVIAATPAARRLVAYVISDRSINATRYNAQHRALNRVFDISFTIGLILICSLYVAAGTYNPFIYFRF